MNYLRKKDSDVFTHHRKKYIDRLSSQIVWSQLSKDYVLRQRQENMITKKSFSSDDSALEELISLFNNEAYSDHQHVFHYQMANQM